MRSAPTSARLHTYGNAFATAWVTIHDTDVDGTAPFDANAAAKAKLGTPFKRPENGQFRPGVKFKEFFFDETGDTDSRTEAGSAFGGFGGVFKLSQKGPSSNTGTLTLFYLGDIVHSGFDNCAFLTKNQIVFVEDAGDTSPHPAQRARLGLRPRRDHRLLEAGQPADPDPGRGA